MRTIKLKRILKSLMIFVLCFSFLMMQACANSYKKSHELIEAIELQDTQKVTALLESGIDPNALPGPADFFLNPIFEYSPKIPLSAACSTGNLEIVQLLISHGATAEYREGAGWSPLVSTLFYYQPNDVEIVELLLENGADIHQEESGWLPVFYASKMIPKVYDAKKSNGTVFFGEYDEETAKGITKIVACLLGDFDINDQTNTTLLMNAAKAGNSALVEYLLSIGADPNLKDYDGKTAYDFAVENGHKETAELLK